MNLSLKDTKNKKINRIKKKPKFLKFFSRKEAFEPMDFFMNDHKISVEQTTIEDFLNYKEDYSELYKDEENFSLKKFKEDLKEIF